MSLHEYRESNEISNKNHEFYALIMAAMRYADGANLLKLQHAFPDVWDELKERYHAPGGMLPDEIKASDARRKL